MRKLSHLSQMLGPIFQQSQKAMMEDRLDHQEIRDAVAKLCAQFPGDYWRGLDRNMAYPTEFVNALTRSGYLAVLIPESYGSSGLPLSAGAAILEEIHRCGCNAACHAQMYTMGTVLRHGSDTQKRKFLPGIASGDLRLQAFGVTNKISALDLAGAGGIEPPNGGIKIQQLSLAYPEPRNTDLSLDLPWRSVLST